MIDTGWRVLAVCAAVALVGVVSAQESVLADARDEALFVTAAETLLAVDEATADISVAAAALRFPDLDGLNLLVRLQRRLPASRELLGTRGRALWTALERGGIHDHVAGGFYRGARDAQWRVPEPGKRLAHQAWFLDVFLDAWLVTGDDRFRAVARGIVGFLRVGLHMPSGAFAAADMPPDAQSTLLVRDERAVSGENGLAIGALARAALVLGDEHALSLATTAAAALHAGQWQTGKGLAHAGWSGADPQPATVWDHACVVQGLLRLHQAGGGLRWLALAVEVQDACDARFWNEGSGGYQVQVAAHEPPRSAATNALLAHNLLGLIGLTDDDLWRSRAQRLLATIRTQVRTNAVPALLAVLDTVDGEAVHLLIAGDPAAADTRALLAVAHAALRPRLHILVLDDSPSFAPLRQRFPAMVAMPRDHGAATAYLCLPQRCLPAVTTAQKLARQFADAVDGR